MNNNDLYSEIMNDIKKNGIFRYKINIYDIIVKENENNNYTLEINKLGKNKYVFYTDISTIINIITMLDNLM